MLGVALLATLVARAAAHGAVSWPRPRNAIDHEDAAAQANATYPYRGQACPSPDGPGRTTGVLGQACFWFSNGCAIGCASCDGKSRGPIPSSGDPRWRRKFDLCGAAARATVCDPRLRTVNTGAACGSEEDWYYYSPWRAPGAAPVFDACGMAGGTPVAGKFGGHYSATAHAKQGDLGSKTLRKAAPSVTWTAGQTVEVAWTVLANHGGGYQYRLCRASEPLTEACFQRLPLRFVGRQSLLWDRKPVFGSCPWPPPGTSGGTRVWFEGTYVSNGTVPEGSMWARNPLPRNDHQDTFAGFAPARGRLRRMWGPYNVEVVDTLALPADLPHGEWVLGWRWDCEESNQVWASCSDVTIVSPARAAS
ncbi:hypothetical protein EMIHUDRAFT_315671 [Emiliania huxleyi CCMP1516]|uniref:Chitin-binding type-4 domain-containing protein n=2 Tax=Emiliania huxleyi TaxID=2903 RepID=A0A0D3JGK7_EMIH1|nr:hypothetical protein EMIHUDRAFT_315671 [Emiliania huxleyi CCMP1516]EOD22642.1 hypothetical protein EMIHUDRAFT_315671 [Emiliania huxleyi CCMP1516]|eukprot:XP_005775071.1 hypothetical protein EMIHUDRAFT_315671 [Emiliania huxleyi CCMP1516]